MASNGPPNPFVFDNLKCPKMVSRRRQRTRSTSTKNTINKKNTSAAQNVAMLERIKKRHLINKFFDLASVVPGSNKMDLISLVEDETKYMKQLQERVKILVVEQEKKKLREEIVTVHKVWGSVENESSYSCHPTDELVPEIEAMAQEKSVLIRIHCKKRRYGLGKILGEIEKHHLSIITMCSIPFTDHFMEITVSAQRDENFSTTMKDLKKNLRQTLDEE